MLYRYLLLCCLCISGFAGYGQVVTECPQNIGFERGNLSNWRTAIGSISQTRDSLLILPRPAVVTLQPTPNPVFYQHAIIERSDARDPFGGFSLNSPNGSDYIVQLGNDGTGRGAEQISYTFNVPAGSTDYSVIFNYAVVFQNPGHDFDEQPKFTARVFDITANTSTSCGSFEFVAQGGIPGFVLSDVPAQNGTREERNVLYKSWSPVFVNLSAYAGHTIRMEFTTNDCSRGGHFGYAYIDFNENCSIPISGNITCPGTQSLTIRTLPGFFEYRWYNADTRELLSTTDSVVLSPVPPIGTRLSVELVPYPGLGCSQTLYTTVGGMYMNILDPPPDCTVVDITDIALKVGNSSDLTYTYWLDAAATRPMRDPKHVYTSGTYYIKGRSTSGCELVRPVRVRLLLVPPLVLIQPLVATYPETADLTRAYYVDEEITYSYWKDAIATVPIPDPTRVGRKATYYIKSVTPEGCVSISHVPVEILIPDIVVPNTFTPNNDGKNDVFTILVNKEVIINTLKIFNRWGDVVYTTPDINNFWNGFKDTTEVPVGVYYWVLDGILNSKRFLRSGYITLLR